MFFFKKKKTYDLDKNLLHLYKCSSHHNKSQNTKTTVADLTKFICANLLQVNKENLHTEENARHKTQKYNSQISKKIISQTIYYWVIYPTRWISSCGLDLMVQSCLRDIYKITTLKFLLFQQAIILPFYFLKMFLIFFNFYANNSECTISSSVLFYGKLINLIIL